MGDIDDQDPFAINVATLIASLLSLMGSSTILLSYLLYSKGTGISKMILFLAISDLGWAFTEIVAFSIIIRNDANYTYHICVIARGFFQFFSGAAVMWSMCICIYLFKSVVIAREPDSDNIILGTKKPRKTMLIYHCVSWGVPLLQCMVLFFPGVIWQLPNQRICMLREPYLGLTWFFPLGIAIAISAALYSVFINRIVRITKATGATASQQLPMRLASYVLILFCCWIPNLVAYILGHYYSWPYRSAVMAPVNGLLELQGAFDCIVYGFTNREFRNNFTGKTIIFQVFLSPILLPIAVSAALYRRWKFGSSESYASLLDTQSDRRHGV